MTFAEMCEELQTPIHSTGCLRRWHAGENNRQVLEVFIQGHGQCPASEDNSWRVHFTGTQFTSFEMDFYAVNTMYNFIRMMHRAWEEAVAFIEQE